MNAAEIKLDLFRRIDNLENNRLEVVYNKIISFLDTEKDNETTLSPELKKALDKALNESKKGNVHTHEDVIQKTKEKYPNLF
jgi:hypothetical protein